MTKLPSPTIHLIRTTMAFLFTITCSVLVAQAKQAPILKIKSNNLTGLFIKKVKKDDLPKFRIRTNLSDLKKEYDKLAKYEKELEELRAPLYRESDTQIDIKEMMEIHKKEKRNL